MPDVNCDPRDSRAVPEMACQMAIRNVRPTDSVPQTSLSSGSDIPVCVNGRQKRNRPQAARRQHSSRENIHAASRWSISQPVASDSSGTAILWLRSGTGVDSGRTDDGPLHCQCGRRGSPLENARSQTLGVGDCGVQHAARQYRTPQRSRTQRQSGRSVNGNSTTHWAQLASGRRCRGAGATDDHHRL